VSCYSNAADNTAAASQLHCGDVTETSWCEDSDELSDLLKAGYFLVAGVIGHFLMKTFAIELLLLLMP